MLKCLKLGILLNIIKMYEEKLEETYIDNILDIVLSICTDLLENKEIQKEIKKITIEEQRGITCETLIELDEQLNTIDKEEYKDIIDSNKILFRYLFNDLNTLNQECLNDKHGLAVLDHFEHLSIVDKFNFSIKSIFKNKNIKCPFNK